MTTTFTTPVSTAQIVQKDMHSPMNSISITKIKSKIMRERHRQQTAGDETTFLGCAQFAGKALKVYFELGEACAAGESFVVDVLKGGVSILTDTATFDNTSAVGCYDISSLLDPDLAVFDVGDVLAVDRNYTAGGGPNAPSTAFTLEWG